MNRRAIITFAALAVIFVICAGAARAATRTVTIRVEGMTCGGCAVIVEEALKKTDGVVEASVTSEGLRGSGMTTGR